MLRSHKRREQIRERERKRKLSGWSGHTTTKTSPEYVNDRVSFHAYVRPDVRFLQPVFIQCVPLVM